MKIWYEIVFFVRVICEFLHCGCEWTVRFIKKILISLRIIVIAIVESTPKVYRHFRKKFGNIT